MIPFVSKDLLHAALFNWFNKKKNTTMLQVRTQRKRQLLPPTLMSLLVAFVFASVMTVETALGADAAPTMASFSCAPLSPEKKLTAGGVFALEVGDSPSFSCSVQSQNAEQKFAAVLVGKQTDAKGVMSASSSDLAVTSEQSGTTLIFPPVFQPGLYQYTFSLIDTVTKQPLSQDVTLTGKLKGTEQSHILSVAFDKEHYEWGAGASVVVTLGVPDGQTFDPKEFLLGGALQGKDGKFCQSVFEKQPVLQAENTYQFTLPEKGECVNALDVSLMTQNGTVVDQKTLAFGVPEMKTADTMANTGMSLAKGMSSAMVIGLILTGILVLVLVGYFLMKKNQKRRF